MKRHATWAAPLAMASALLALLPGSVAWGEEPVEPVSTTAAPSMHGASRTFRLQPCFTGAKVIGIRPNTPFLHVVAAAGSRPMKFSISNLPEGLTLDPGTGIIRGTLAREGTYHVPVAAGNAYGAASTTLTLVVGDRLALTPPMGWMAWNTFGPNINEKLFKEIADAMVQKGLRDAGYQYVNIDDHWSGKRDAKGRFVPYPRKFPNGIRTIADYLHERGLKLGIYSCAGTKTCGGEPGSFGRERIDAETFAQWGVDYLKYDYCFAPKDRPAAERRYRAMANALKKTDRSIVFGVCEWGRRKPWLWAAEVGGHLWRTTWDIRDIWHHGKYDGGHAGIIQIVDQQADLYPYAGPSRWNDPDMLVVGIHGRGLSSSHDGASGCTEVEYRTQMGLWCLMAAPLFISCDVRNLDDECLATLTNPEVIDVDQDPLGRQAARVKKDGELEIWSKPMQDGSLVVGLLNRDNEQTHRIVADWKTLDIKGPQRVRDLWKRENLGTFDKQFAAEVPSHGLVLLRITPLQLKKQDFTKDDWGMGPFVTLDKPVLEPTDQTMFHCPVLDRDVAWEALTVYNPTVTVRDGKVHMIYMGWEWDAGKTFPYGRGLAIANTHQRLGLAVSEDGRHFKRLGPVLYPDNDSMKEYEWPRGPWDPRLVEDQDGTYYLYYNSLGNRPPQLCVATSKDLVHWMKHGPVFDKLAPMHESISGSVVWRLEPDGRRAAAKLDGKYWMYFDHYSRVAVSDDLINWKPNGRQLWGYRPGYFDSASGEPGTAMLTDAGILFMYTPQNHSWGPDHGADPNYPAGAWLLGQCLTDRNDPARILHRADKPFVFSEHAWEKVGISPNCTVMHDGLIYFKGEWLLYYGGGDRNIGLAVHKPKTGSPYYVDQAKLEEK